jgi:transketolase
MSETAADHGRGSRQAGASQRDIVNVLRALAMDAVEKAKSGHPGMPMGMAEIAEVLWRHHLRHNPANPQWIDRDRFVLSNGHGSMLLYALLHLTGYDLPMDELKRFRQLHSKTPGHPEYGITSGVETTTGPLGQGLANSVGLALAERMLAAQFNRPGYEIIDHHTYVFLGDGCLMEGISHEACSLAGTLKLGKLIGFYDDNGISIDGHVKGWFTDDTPKRFEAYGWHVVPHVDGHDSAAVEAALEAALRDPRPSLICCKTLIAKGAPNKVDTHDAHGAPLGEKEIAATRVAIGWPYPPFEVPQVVYAAWDARARGTEREDAWNASFARYRSAHPELAQELSRRMAGELPEDFGALVERALAAAEAKGESIATRKASQNALDQYGPALPELFGGSADLTGSNLTFWSGSKYIDDHYAGNYVSFGVREFGMAAMLNGITLHGGFIPYGGTFLTFSDYSRNALRLGALMKIRVIHVFSHDSIGLGEDGPTHQSIEHASSLRLIPNMDVWRPCDTVETLAAWAAAIERQDGPTSLLLSRQSLPFPKGSTRKMEEIRRGGYVLWEPSGGAAQAVIIATGSEVGLALGAQKLLAEDGVRVRVVSMPCTRIFDAQESAYRERVLGRGLPRVAVEAGVSDYWRKYVGLDGAIVGIDTYGESAPAGDVFKYFGFTPERVAAAVKSVI